MLLLVVVVVFDCPTAKVTPFDPTHTLYRYACSSVARRQLVMCVTVSSRVVVTDS